MKCLISSEDIAQCCDSARTYLYASCSHIPLESQGLHSVMKVEHV